MRPSLIAGHAAGAGTTSAVWCTAVSLAPGSADWRLIAAGILAPPVIAALGLAVIHARQVADARPAVDQQTQLATVTPEVAR